MNRRDVPPEYERETEMPESPERELYIEVRSFAGLEAKAKISEAEDVHVCWRHIWSVKGTAVAMVRDEVGQCDICWRERGSL